MKIVFQPHLEITPQQLLNFPEKREIKMEVVPRIGEKIWIGGKLYEIVNVHYDCPGIVVFVK